MKATLSFDFDTDGDRSAHRRATQADDMYFSLLEIAQYLRAKAKYTEDEEERQVHLQTQREFFGVLEARGIDLDILA
jgi:hypothetical protein